MRKDGASRRNKVEQGGTEDIPGLSRCCGQRAPSIQRPNLTQPFRGGSACTRRNQSCVIPGPSSSHQQVQSPDTLFSGGHMPRPYVRLSLRHTSRPRQGSQRPEVT